MGMLASQAIKVWGESHRVAMQSRSIPALLVGKKDNHIGLFDGRAPPLRSMSPEHAPGPFGTVFFTCTQKQQHPGSLPALAFIDPTSDSNANKVPYTTNSTRI